MATSSGSVSVPGTGKSQGKTPLITKQSLYEESSTQNHMLGTRLDLGDGRVFRYTKNGATALAAGKLIQCAVPVANHLNCAAYAAAAVGAMKVSVTLGATALTINYYAEGYMHCNDVSPEGHIYKISHHLAADASAVVVVNLFDPIVKALTTSSEVTLTKHPNDGVVIAPNGGLTQPIIGVPIIDVTASYYFWAQTWGSCAVLTQGTVVVGMGVGLGGTADGACGPIAITGNAAADTAQSVGVVRQVNASTEYSLIDLRIAP